MTDFDWTGLGSSIRDLVQDAVDSRDFEKLSANISKTIQTAFDEVGNGMREAGQTAGRVFDETARNVRRHPSHEREYTGQKRSAAFQEPVLFVNIKGSRIGGIIRAAAGYTLALVFGILFLVFFLRAVFDVWAGFGTWTAAVVFAVLTAGSLAVGIQGSSLLALVRRFQSYIRVLGGRSFCDLHELASDLGKDLKYIHKDIRRMIEKNWFLEGHLDRQETCLIVSNATYQQYLNAEEQRRIRQRQEEEKGGIPVQVQDVLEAGNAYIKRIRKCNEDIPGEEISVKISRIEQLIQQIFAQVEENPENVSDIRKLMDYYLPTTVKLLDAYAQLDAQPVQGEYIASSKKEIEDALDTLNTAFEKLLDSLFRDRAWDVSSDISVLETMLAQEGLTGDNFRRERT